MGIFPSYLMIESLYTHQGVSVHAIYHSHRPLLPSPNVDSAAKITPVTLEPVWFVPYYHIESWEEQA